MTAIPRATSPADARAGANPYTPPRARVRDVVRPKTMNVQAGLGARLGASFVDAFVFSAMVTVPLFASALLLGTMGPRDEASATTALMIAFGMAFLGFVAWAWLTLRGMAANGQSIAKKWFGIKVVRSDGSEASLGNLIWKRNVINWLLGIIPLYAIIEVLFIFGEDRQCLHDKIADTIVIEA